MRRIAPADGDLRAKGDEDRSEEDSISHSELEWSLASLKPGDHLCLIYNSFHEWRATVVPFVASGLRRGEMCLYIRGKESPGDLRELLEEEGMDPKAAEDSGQLVILDCREAYVGEGEVDPRHTIALLRSFAERAIAEGYPALRISGEMSSPFQSASSRQRFLDYESKLDELFDRHPCLGLCQYDRSRSDAELIRDAITTHPQLIQGYKLYKNKYYIPPKDLQSPESWEREVEHRLENIRIDGEGEELFGQLAENIDNIFFIKDIINNKFIYISPAFERLFCRPRVALYREADDLLEAVHPEDRQLVSAALRCQEPGRINEIEYRIVTGQGEIRWMHTQAFVVLNEEGRAYRLAGIISDVTTHKLADERLNRLNQVLRAFGRVTELAARENDRVGLLSKACNELVASGGYGLVWIGGLDGEKVIPLARCGKGVQYLDRITITWDEGETGQGPTGRAIRSRKTIVCRDLEGDPRFKPWREEALAQRFASSMAVPIIHGERLFGVLNLYSKDSTAFDQEEVELMEGVAGNLAFALWTIDEKERRKRVETALGESEERYRLVARNIPVMVYSALPDEHSTCLFASGRIEELTGYPVERFFGDLKHWNEMIHPDDREMVWEGIHLHRENKAPLDLEYRIVTSDGSTKWISDKANPVIDGDGVIERIDGFREDITERKIAEEALQEQLHLLQQLIDAIPNPIFYKDAVGYYLGCNTAFESYTGLNREEILRKTVFQLFPPDLAEIYHRADEELIRAQGKQIYEASVEHSDGTRHEVIFNKATFFDTEGRLAGLVGVILDISERKRAEDLVRESERRLAGIIDFLPDATFVVDANGKVIAWNRAIEAMTGVKAVEMLGKGELEYAIPFYGERRPILIDLILQPQDEVESEYLKIERLEDKLVAEAYVPRMNTILWAVAAILYDSEGNRMGAIESLRDISERKRAEDLVRESERRLADIIDFLPDATLVIDVEGKVIAWNRAIEAMTGVKAEEMLGKGELEHSIPFYGERRPILIDLVLLPEDMVEKNYISVERDGQMLFGENYIPQLDTILWGVAAILYDSKGNRIGAIESIRDISEHRKAQEELRKAKEGAEAASRAKSEFLANMSHEIRTPMNAVIGMASLLLGTCLDSEQRDFVETIRSSGDSLLSIINDILDFTKIEERKLELESRPFSIREVIEEALDVVALSASEKGLELAYCLEELVPQVLIGDPTRGRQILVNLLGNAVKFTERGEVVVTVRPGDGDDEVHLAVSDTGIGMPEEFLEKLFQPFSQVDSSSTRRYGGTGLGLAISKHLAEMMGGRIWAESSTGLGSTFHVTIKAQGGPTTSPSRGLFLEGKRALIVEGNRTTREALAGWLKSWGMAATAVGEATPDLLQKPFDVLLMGSNVAEELAPYVGDRPLVLLTRVGQRRRLSALSRVRWLAKPVKYESLSKLLANIFLLEDELPSAEQAPVNGNAARFAERKVLLAEDNPVNQKVALKMLQRLGIWADLARSGREVLEAMENADYDLIFMDVQMPDMDGLETTKMIRSTGKKEPYIVAMTAHALQEIKDKCLDAGMDDYISKPVRIEELKALLERIPV